MAQVPPVYSALKVDGKRAYDLARAGEAVEMKTRSVVIHRISIRSDPADGPVKNVTLTAYVSKGTYIRSLSRDISMALGTVGPVDMLRRTRAGPFTLDKEISLEQSRQYGKCRTFADINL